MVIVFDLIADKFTYQRRYYNNSNNNNDNLQRNYSNSKPEYEQIRDVSDNVAKLFRTVIECLGLLVGLCWEKAADAAIEIIVEGDEFLHQHVVISKVSFATIMMVFMLTAWVRYI